MDKNTVICVVGTTASGKSGLSVDLACHYSGEVVSADSMQIYRGFNIGTAKIMPDAMRGIPHHMLDIVAPSASFSVAQYCAAAVPIIESIQQRGKIAIVAGGTGLYVDSLLASIDFVDMKVDDAYRAELTSYARANGNIALWEKLNAVDPDCAARLHPNNLRRVIRALEVCRLTGKTMSESARDAVRPPRFPSVWIGLRFADREEQYRRIDARVDAMVADGLENEVRTLLASGLPRDCQAMQAIGYKEFVPVIDGMCIVEEAVEQIKRNSRRYAKRQLTWFNRRPDIQWIEVDRIDDKDNLLNTAIELLEST